MLHPCYQAVGKFLLGTCRFALCFTWCEGPEQTALHIRGMPFTVCVRHIYSTRERALAKKWRAAGSCTQNNTCGGGAFPELMGFQCKGFNPEGQGLGTAGRCASNAYDNMGYLTLDFTCATSPCKVDGDCQVVSGHDLQNTPSVAGMHESRLSSNVCLTDNDAPMP